jgi:hypothetical protein
LTELRDELLVADWRFLSPAERWRWWTRLWSDVILLCERYRLELRTGWWTEPEVAERLEAFSRWVWMHDCGRLHEAPHSSPPGKLALLDYLRTLRSDVAGGDGPFHPGRDWAAYARHAVTLGADPPADADLQLPPPRPHPREAT